MIRLCFKINAVFWMLSPIAYATGWALGVWRTQHDWVIGLFLVFMSGLASFLSFDTEKHSG